MPANSNSALVIPIRIDFIYINSNSKTFAQARAKFEHLPYNNGKAIVNSENAYLSDSISSQPFQNNNLILKKGVHLHWALPDALTRSKTTVIDGKEHVKHIAIPDRWIVNKKKNNNVVNTWIVESTYLHPEGKDNKYHSISYPLHYEDVGQPYRYMGRSYKYGYIPKNPNAPEYLDHITAVGYGEPTFASFYPNCHSVLGFHDPSVKNENDLIDVEYEVLGWYGNPKADLLIKNNHDVIAEDYKKRALNFDGNGDYVELTNDKLPQNNQAFTIEVWIRTISDASSFIVTWGSEIANTRVGLIISKNGNLEFVGQSNSIAGSKIVNDGKWHHVALSYEKTEIKIYVDGQLDISQKIKPLNTKGQTLIIGKRFSPGPGLENTTFSLFYLGDISELRIWNVARTFDDINSYRNCEVDPNHENLVSYFQFNQGNVVEDNKYDDFLLDSCPNGHNGALINFDLKDTQSNWVDGPEILSKYRQAFAFLKKNFNLNMLPNDGTIALHDVGYTLCYGILKLDSNSETPAKRAVNSLSIGNSSTEALSALLEKKLNIPNAHIEKKLESIQLASKVTGSKLDAEERFNKAFHEKEFFGIDGGHIWKVLIKSNSTSPNQKKANVEEILLPVSTAHVVNELNKQQQLHDKYVDELISLRQELYTDWCKYQITAYHPDIETNLPDMDDARFFIEQVSFKVIEEKEKEIEESQKWIDQEKARLEHDILLFNTSFYFEKVALNADNNLDLDHSIPFRKRIADQYFTDSEYKDPELKIGVQKIPEDKLKAFILDLSTIPNTSIRAISMYVKVNDDSKDTGKLIQIKDTSTTPNPEIELNSIIGKNGIEKYWQKIVINGTQLDSNRKLSWEDIPKDKWLHLYLEGEADLSSSIKLSILEGLSGSIAGIRCFNNKLTSFEIFCDRNMLSLYKLTMKVVKGPRYWQPTDPVIILEGNDVEPSQRYGFDGELDCLLVKLKHADNEADISGHVYHPNVNTAETENIKTSYTKRVDNLIALFPTINQEFSKFTNSHISNLAFNHKPWHPLFMEWKVSLSPLRDDKGSDQYKYPSNFLTSAYYLGYDGVSLTHRNKNTGRGINIFTGSSILTPHAKKSLSIALISFLKGLKISDDDWKNYISNYTSAADIPANNIFNIPDDQEIMVVVNAEILKLKTNAIDIVSIALKALKTIDTSHYLSQSLGGFNAALMMLHQTYQLPIADPIGFEDDKIFAEKVRAYVKRESKFAALPLFDFDPLRTGSLKLLELNIIDSFGQIKPAYDNNSSANKLTYSRSMNQGELSPRIIQPARLAFRWLSAENDEVEMNEHAASSPICGWLLPNYIDNSIMVYDSDGNALGSIHGENEPWRSAPGNNYPLTINELPNQHLKTVVCHLLSIDDTDRFIELLEITLDKIDPESGDQHADIAMLWGRPIAIARASLSIEVKGELAVNQDWNTFNEYLVNLIDKRSVKPEEFKRSTLGWEDVNFYCRVGEPSHLNDGVVGYWIDNVPNHFHSTLSISEGIIDSEFTKGTKTLAYNELNPNIELKISDKPLNITMLLDPRGVAHAVVGVLPSKEISIPASQFKAALKNINISFFSRPILMPKGKIAIPLPSEQDYHWTWLAKEQEEWKEVSTKGITYKKIFTNTFINGADIWEELKIKGWINEIDTKKAEVVPISLRKTQDQRPLIISQHEKIQAILDIGHITHIHSEAHLHEESVIKEGWLKLSPNRK